jgi:hypothetical protein
MGAAHPARGERKCTRNNGLLDSRVLPEMLHRVISTKNTFIQMEFNMRRKKKAHWRGLSELIPKGIRDW